MNDNYSVFVERNLQGKELERIGRIDDAISLYELNVADDFEGSHPYDRLATIYHERKDYNNERRILEHAIYVFENIVYSQRSDRLCKLNRYKHRLEKLNTLLKNEWEDLL